MSPLMSWWEAATAAEREALATALQTSPKYLHHYATGRRSVSAGRGIVLERETKALHKATGGRLPIIYRTDVVPACRGCEFARRCLGEDRLIAGEFGVIKEK